MERYLKASIDVVITLLIITILGVVGFIGFRLYQDQQGNTASEVASAPLPQSVQSVATPVPQMETQIEPTAEVRLTSSTGIPACTEAERQQIIDVLIAQDDRFFVELPWLEDDSIDTVQDFSAAVIDIDRYIAIYHTEYYAQFPECADGLFFRDLMGLLYEDMLNMFALYVLEVYVSQNGDTATQQLIHQAAEDYSDYVSETADINIMIAAQEAGGVMPDGFPACGDQAAAKLSLYQPLMDEYQSLIPAFTDFMTNRYGDFNTLFRFETMALEMMQLETEFCEENFETEVLYNRLLIDTTVAVHVAQLASFEELRGRQTTADALESIVSVRYARAMEIIEQLAL